MQSGRLITFRTFFPAMIMAAGAAVAFVLVRQFQDHQLPIIATFVVIAAIVRGWTKLKS